MLCSYLKDVYDKHIDINLVDEELKYSRTIIEEILDIWNNCTEKKSINHPNVIFYYNNHVECFRFYIDDDRLHIADEIFNPVCDKYSYNFGVLDFFEFVIHNYTNLGKHIYCT